MIIKVGTSNGTTFRVELDNEQAQVVHLKFCIMNQLKGKIPEDFKLVCRGRDLTDNKKFLSDLGIDGRAKVMMIESTAKAKKIKSEVDGHLSARSD